MSIVLMDTSVFCNVLDVPGFNQDRDSILSELEERIRSRDTLLLPMAAVLETGNHIAQIAGGGGLRRMVAQRFCDSVSEAIDGALPWTPTPFWEVEQLRIWLSEFADYAMRGVGMGDLSIIKEWERQCELFPRRRVIIWSLDGDLQGYDQRAK